MLETQTPIRFFMGVNSPGGFFGYLDDFYDCSDGWRSFLIKSGPGTGKASLIRSVLEHLAGYELQIEALVCSSDPDSLDGLVFPELKTCLLDATAPHIMEPKYWGAVEQIVNLSDCMNAGELHTRAPEIIEASEACALLHTRCRKFIGAAASLLSDSCRIAQEHTDQAKILRSAARIAAREFGPHSGRRGKERRRFLSAVTPQGCITFQDTLQSLCPRIYSLEDEYGASSRLLLDELRRRALDAGHDVISCYCPLFPQEKLDHLLIPGIGVGFTTSNPWHKTDFPVYRRIHSARFTDTEGLRTRRQLLSFNRRAAKELLNEAVLILEEAKRAHDRIEEFYVGAMDWKSATLLTGQTVGEFEDIYAKSVVPGEDDAE